MIPAPWVKSYRLEFEERFGIEEFLCIWSMLEYEEENKGGVGASAIVISIPPALMMERYFSTNYTRALNMKLWHKLKGHELELFPKNQFRPSAHGPMIEKLIKLADVCAPTQIYKYRY